MLSTSTVLVHWTCEISKFSGLKKLLPAQNIFPSDCQNVFMNKSCPFHTQPLSQRERERTRARKLYFIRTVLVLDVVKVQPNLSNNQSLLSHR